MARVSKEQSQRNRETIVQVASDLFRERGLAGIGVADLMGAAGLTHGGFYGHFASKDDLAAEAAARAFEQVAELWQEGTGTPDERRAAYEESVTHYLLPAHRDAPSHGCPMAALAADVAREPDDKPIRQVFQKGIAASVDALAALSSGGREEALRELSLLVGTMILARATKGVAISDEFLDAARRQLVGQA